MRGNTAKLLAVLVIAGLAAAFGGCAFACDSGDDHADDVEGSHCTTHCVCHSMNLVPQHPAVVTTNLSRQPYRIFDEQVKLPLFVADIFNPPRV